MEFLKEMDKICEAMKEQIDFACDRYNGSEEAWERRSAQFMMESVKAKIEAHKLKALLYIGEQLTQIKDVIAFGNHLAEK